MNSYYKETEPFLENLHYCTRCCMPASNEGVSFDELGICSACNSAEHKIHINWSVREKKLKALLDEQKEKNKDDKKNIYSSIFINYDKWLYQGCLYTTWFHDEDTYF